MSFELIRCQVRLLEDAAKRSDCDFSVHGNYAAHSALGSNFYHNDMTATLPCLIESHFL